MTVFKDLETEYQKSLKQSGVKSLPQYEKNYQKALKQGQISTITGKPIPTTQEQIYAGKKVAAEMAPIVGDIALTALAPEFELGQLGLKSPLAVKAINAAMRAVGAGTGGAIGEYGRQKILGQSIDPERIKLQAALGAGGELGGSALIAGGKRLARPLINWTADATQIAKPFARAAIKYQRNLQQSIKEKTTGRMLNFIERFSGMPPDIAGKKVGTALKGQLDFEQVYKPWTEAIDRIAAENNGIIPLDDATQAITDLVEKFSNNKRSRRDAINEASRWLGFSGSKDKPMVNAIINEIYEDGYMAPADVKFLMSRFWKSYGTKTTAKANTWKEAFKASFLDDLDRYGFGAAQARKVADQTFGSIQNFIRESPAADKILSRMNFGKSDRLYFEEYPGRVAETIFGKSDNIKNMINTKKDPEAIMQLRNVITNTGGGEEAWTAISFNYISDLMRSSIKQAPDTGKSIILPAELAEKIYQAEDTIRAAFPAGTWNRLKKEADHLFSVASKFEKLEVNEGYDIFTSFGVLHPKGQKIIEKIGKGGAWTGKQLLKTAGHLAGPPALMSAHGTK